MSEPLPSPPALARQDSFSRHATVFEGLFSYTLEAAKSGMEKVKYSDELFARGVEATAISPNAGFTWNGERTIQEKSCDLFAQEAFAGDAADLEAYAATLDPQAGADLNDILARIWEEYDTDGDGVITADTTKHLIKAYLIKGKAFLPQYLSFVKEISAPSFIRTITVMGGDAVDQESIPVLKALVDEVSERVISESLGPILAEIDVAIEGSDALAADLHAAMDLNHDGLVQKAEFFSTFDQCIANVFSPTAIGMQVSVVVGQVVGAVLSGGGDPGDPAGEGSA